MPIARRLARQAGSRAARWRRREQALRERAADALPLRVTRHGAAPAPAPVPLPAPTSPCLPSCCPRAQVIVVMVLLWMEIGPAAAAGVLLMMLLIPLQGAICRPPGHPGRSRSAPIVRALQAPWRGRRLGRGAPCLSSRTNASRCARCRCRHRRLVGMRAHFLTQLMTEIISGIRVVKLYGSLIRCRCTRVVPSHADGSAWEDPFAQRVRNVRNREAVHEPPCQVSMGRGTQQAVACRSGSGARVSFRRSTS